MKTTRGFKFWLSELFAVLSVIPWVLITFFTGYFSSFVSVVYSKGYEVADNTMVIYDASGYLFLLTGITLIIVIFGFFKFRDDVNTFIYVRRVLYTILFIIGLQALAYGFSDFSTLVYDALTNPNVVTFSYGLGYIVFSLQILLISASFISSWAIKLQEI